MIFHVAMTHVTQLFTTNLQIALGPFEAKNCLEGLGGMPRLCLKKALGAPDSPFKVSDSYQSPQSCDSLQKIWLSLVFWLAGGVWFKNLHVDFNFHGVWVHKLAKIDINCLAPIRVRINYFGNNRN